MPGILLGTPITLGLILARVNVIYTFSHKIFVDPPNSHQNCYPYFIICKCGLKHTYTDNSKAKFISEGFN